MVVASGCSDPSRADPTTEPPTSQTQGVGEAAAELDSKDQTRTATSHTSSPQCQGLPINPAGRILRVIPIGVDPSRLSALMGAFLDKPKTEKYNEVGNGTGFQYGIGTMQGRVSPNQVASSILLSLLLQHFVRGWTYLQWFNFFEIGSFGLHSFCVQAGVSTWRTRTPSKFPSAKTTMS